MNQVRGWRQLTIKSLRGVLLGALLAGLCVCVLPFLVGTKPLEVGTTAPAFTLTSLTGEPVSLADFAGQPILLNFWTTT